MFPFNVKDPKTKSMKPPVNNKNSFFSNNEDIELFSNFPWKKSQMNRKIQDIEHQKDLVMTDKGQLKSSASKIKSIAGICFITDVKGFFKYIHPNFLKFMEGMENQFFETSIFDFNQSEGLPPSIDYLVEMIQENRTSVFIKNTFKNKPNGFSKLQWKISYYGGLLNFKLLEQPVSSGQKDFYLESKPSKRKVLMAEIKKIYESIEQAKTFRNEINYPEGTLLH